MKGDLVSDDEEPRVGVHPDAWVCPDPAGLAPKGELVVWGESRDDVHDEVVPLDCPPGVHDAPPVCPPCPPGLHEEPPVCPPGENEDESVLLFHGALLLSPDAALVPPPPGDDQELPALLELSLLSLPQGALPP